jgi:hypothetical protein
MDRHPAGYHWKARKMTKRDDWRGSVHPYSSLPDPDQTKVRGCDEAAAVGQDGGRPTQGGSKIVTPAMVDAGVLYLYGNLSDYLPVNWPLAEVFVRQLYIEMSSVACDER